ncbi:MAG: glutamine amidotransferase [Fuerstiella sp.]
MMYSLASLIIGDRQWLWPAIVIAVVGIGWAIVRGRRSSNQTLATVFRSVGWLLISLCLINPLWSSAKPKRGANVFAVVADVSRSHQVDASESQTRAEQLATVLDQGELQDSTGWIQRIAQDFELQRYVLSDHLQRVTHLDDLSFDGEASSICLSLRQLQERFAGQPLAGMILLSDGNATDLQPVGELFASDSVQRLAPVFPVLLPQAKNVVDAMIGKVTTSQTAFDDAPVTIQVIADTTGATGKQLKATLLDAKGTPLDTKIQSVDDDPVFRFETRPDTAGTVFYKAKLALLDNDGETELDEATLVNNEVTVAVQRGSRSRRVLYVSGRPNWEFKFLRRAVETDPQTDLVGLIRIARKEAKFAFRGREGETSNSLFRGFDEVEQELAEEFDEPVMVRLGTEDETELLGGFPEDAKDLFRYDAIIIDDLEADFFTADQMQLIQQFVAKRGGGLLMMGGQESFRQGEYDRTPVGQMLPLDLQAATVPFRGAVSLSLTRDGWLQPWIRLRDNEDAERMRVSAMPKFVTLNPGTNVRPGAIVMASVKDQDGTEFPALVTQRFGRGRSAALCVGDFWRWRMNEGRRRLSDFSPALVGPDDSPIAPGEQPEEDLNDHARACRQMVRWLVADVPERLSVRVQADVSRGPGTMVLLSDVRHKNFDLCDDADVSFEITQPNGQVLNVTGEPSDDIPGRFQAVVAALDAGRWTAKVSASIQADAEEPEVLLAETGWASQPDQLEMKSVKVNETFLQQVATETDGQLIPLDQLDDFVESLSYRDAPLVERQTSAVWNQWWVFLLAVGCFGADWTIRRRQGLP